MHFSSATILLAPGFHHLAYRGSLFVCGRVFCLSKVQGPDRGACVWYKEGRHSAREQHNIAELHASIMVACMHPVRLLGGCCNGVSPLCVAARSAFVFMPQRCTASVTPFGCCCSFQASAVVCVAAVQLGVTGLSRVVCCLCCVLRWWVLVVCGCWPALLHSRLSSRCCCHSHMVATYSNKHV